MKNKHILMIIMLFLVCSLSIQLSDARIILRDSSLQGIDSIIGDINVSGDLGVENLTVNNFYLQGRIYGDGSSLTNISSDSLSLSSIRFKLGEIVDNIVDGWIRITGNLNVTGGLSVNESALFVSSVNNMVGIGTVTPQQPLNVIGDINVTGNFYANDVRGFTGSCVNITYSKGLAITCND